VNLTHGDVKTILEIIDRAEHLDEIELVFSGLKLHVRRSAGERVASSAQTLARPTVAAASSSSAVSQQSAPLAPSNSSSGELAANEVAIRAPMIGTFYRASAPGEKPFVEVGQRVKADDSVAVIEVMKLFNTIRAEVDGTVVRIEAQNATLVEFGQPLVIIAKD
jgi:acetyl-CoA carboxylase biotin carboxyl carrier protein